MTPYTIACVSSGKDSLVIPHECVRRGERLDEVVMYDTGMEFQAIYDTWAQLCRFLDANGIKHTVLKPEYDFRWNMLERPVNVGKPNEHLGYSWCGGVCRWGTTDKNVAMDRYAEARNATVLVGIAADEKWRLDKAIKPYKRHPLIDWGMTEAGCPGHGLQAPGDLHTGERGRHQPTGVRLEMRGPSWRAALDRKEAPGG